MIGRCLVIQQYKVAYGSYELLTMGIMECPASIISLGENGLFGLMRNLLKSGRVLWILHDQTLFLPEKEPISFSPCPLHTSLTLRPEVSIYHCHMVKIFWLTFIQDHNIFFSNNAGEAHVISLRQKIVHWSQKDQPGHQGSTHTHTHPAGTNIHLCQIADQSRPENSELYTPKGLPAHKLLEFEGSSRALKTTLQGPLEHSTRLVIAAALSFAHGPDFPFKYSRQNTW